MGNGGIKKNGISGSKRRGGGGRWSGGTYEGKGAEGGWQCQSLKHPGWNGVAGNALKIMFQDRKKFCI